jgi:hypothetical protein
MINRKDCKRRAEAGAGDQRQPETDHRTSHRPPGMMLRNRSPDQGVGSSIYHQAPASIAWVQSTGERAATVTRTVLALQNLGFYSSHVSIAGAEARHVAISIEREAYNDAQRIQKGAGGSGAGGARQHYARRVRRQPVPAAAAATAAADRPRRRPINPPPTPPTPTQEALRAGAGLPQGQARAEHAGQQGCGLADGRGGPGQRGQRGQRDQRDEPGPERGAGGRGGRPGGGGGWGVLWQAAPRNRAWLAAAACAWPCLHPGPACTPATSPVRARASPDVGP